MAAAVPVPGDLLVGRFRVEEEIGRGGMGVVLRGRGPDNQAVAIKVLLPEAIDHPEAVPRFINEAKAARELTSEHCVRVHEAGTLESGLPFMVMELLEGTDLETVLKQSGPMPIADACDDVIEACDALAEAHALGIVHRDLKPSNLFRSKQADGGVRVKVLDFGVSKVAATMRAAALTSTGTILGSPHYMAPEQLKSSKGVDLRADVWSLGVVLYELTSGKVPFDGASFGHLFMQIVSEEPAPVETLRTDIPPGLAEIIARCMKKNRDERYADLAALVGSLARFASPKGKQVARRIAEGRGPPAAPRESKPSFKGLAGTMMMANAPLRPSSGSIAAAAPQVSVPPSPPAAPPMPAAPTTPRGHNHIPTVMRRAPAKSSPAVVIAIVSAVVIVLVVGMGIGLLVLRR